MFDEIVFPFSKLHPNAGARLRAKISLLPDNLLNSVRNGNTDDASVVSSTNRSHESSDDSCG